MCVYPIISDALARLCGNAARLAADLRTDVGDDAKKLWDKIF